MASDERFTETDVMREWDAAVGSARHNFYGCLSQVWRGHLRDFAHRIYALRDAHASEVARARVEGARDVLEKCAKAMAEGCAGSRSSSECGYWIRVAEHVRDYLDREYPAPKPAEVVLSDGARVTAHCLTDRMWVLRVNGDSSGADFDALKAFASTIAGGGDGNV